MGDSRFEYVCGERPSPLLTSTFDIVFVHGLTGDSRTTWTHANDAFWPGWLAADCSSVNVYTAGYDSSFFGSLLKGDGASLGDQATIILDRLLSRPTPNRPVLFVTHSLGGLIVKQMLRKSKDASSLRRKRLSQNTIGVVFIATPHQGAQFASSVNSILRIGLSAAVKDLSYGKGPLIDLGQWFSTWATETKIVVECYYEVEKCGGVLVVDQTTVDPHVYGCDPIAVQANHISITKLETRHAQLYQSLHALVQELLSKSPPQDDFGSSGGSEIESEYKTYTEPAADDRRTLAQKLTAAHRVSEIPRAERQKERFSMTLHRSIAQPAAVRRYTKLMSNIETRFHRHVAPAICSGKPAKLIDELIQDNVIDPCFKADDLDAGDSTTAAVESAYYYLAGNCHIGWDND